MPSNFQANATDLDDIFIQREYTLLGASHAGLWVTGLNNYGQVGDGTTDVSYYFKQLGTSTGWAEVSASDYASYAIDTSGRLWSWGRNDYGYLGLNDTTHRSSPTQVGSLTNWSKINAGMYGGYALKTDGTIWGWGGNWQGQVGIGNTTSPIISPVQIGAATDWAYISGGYASTGAIKTNGTLWMWGDNGAGSLGLGDRTPRSSPTQVGSLTNWKQVECWSSATLAIKTDGTLWAWGFNNSGELGLNNSPTRYSSPVQVGSLTNWKQIGMGYGVMHAIKTDGTLWAWGEGRETLGLSTTNNVRSPTQVGTLTNWSSVGRGGVGGKVFIKTDGTLWGSGSGYVIGNGINGTVSSPVQVGPYKGWKKVASGWNQSLAIGSDV